MKTFDDMCIWAHYSPGVAKGGKFTPFTCGCCGYKAMTESKWRADLNAYEKMSDEEKALKRTHEPWTYPMSAILR